MFRFTKKKPAEIDRLEAELVGGAFGTRRGEPAGDSDRLVSRAFDESVPSPDFAAVEAELCRYIAEAAERGALDEGSARYADQWILKKLGGWLERLQEQSRLRSDVAARIVGYRTANLTVAAEHLAVLEGRLAQDRAEMTRLEVILLGEPRQEQVILAPLPAVTPAPLPPATHLHGLTLRDESSDESIITVPTEWSADPADLSTEH